MISVAIVYQRFADVVPPTTVEEWMAKNAEVGACLNIRGANWMQSYLREDGRRAVCLYEAPYVEAVREALRESNQGFEAVWKTEVVKATDEDAITASESKTTATATNRVLVEIDIKKLPSAEEWQHLKATAKDRLQTQDIQWLLTLTSSTTQGEIWVFNATAVGEIEQIFKDLAVPITGVWRSQLLTP